MGICRLQHCFQPYQVACTTVRLRVKWHEGEYENSAVEPWIIKDVTGQSLKARTGIGRHLFSERPDMLIILYEQEKLTPGF